MYPCVLFSCVVYIDKPIRFASASIWLFLLLLIHFFLINVHCSPIVVLVGLDCAYVRCLQWSYYYSELFSEG